VGLPLRESLIVLVIRCGSTLGWFATLWALNGILQGWGGPACAKLISAWYAGGERGTYWGLWNISHNFGAFLAPLLAGTAAVRLGWRASVWAPAAVALVISALVALAVRDSPEKMGRVSAETAWAHARGEQTEICNEIAEVRTEIGEVAELAPGAVVDVSEPSTGADATQAVAVVSTTPAATTTPRAEMDAMVGANVQSGDGMIQRLLTNVLSSGRIWVLALAFLCVYLLRQGLTTWLIFYLVETQGVANFSQAAARVSGLELGGLVGSLYAGRLSDHMIARARPGQGFVGRRLLVVRGYLIGLFGALASLRTLPNVWWLQWLTVFGVGFFLYGPQVRMSTDSPLGWPL
jgi:sugar phosphate permease